MYIILSSLIIIIIDISDKWMRMRGEGLNWFGECWDGIISLMTQLGRLNRRRRKSGKQQKENKTNKKKKRK